LKLLAQRYGEFSMVVTLNLKKCELPTSTNDIDSEELIFKNEYFHEKNPKSNFIVVSCGGPTVTFFIITSKNRSH